MRNMYVNLLSRPSTTSSVAGRGVAMYVQGGVSEKTCHIGNSKVISERTARNTATTTRRTTGRSQQNRGKAAAAEVRPSGALYPQVHDSQRRRVQRAAAVDQQTAAPTSPASSTRVNTPTSSVCSTHANRPPSPTGHRRQRTTAMPPYQRRQRSAAMPARQLRQREPPLSIRPQCPTATLAGVIDNSGGLPGRVFVHGTHGHCG